MVVSYSASDRYDADNSGMNSTQCERSIQTIASELEASSCCDAQESLNVDQTNATVLESPLSTESEVVDGNENTAAKSDIEKRSTLMNTHKSSPIPSPPALEKKKKSDFVEFIKNLRKRQHGKEREVKKFLKANPEWTRCTHKQNSEFKCLAISPNEINLSQHLKFHRKNLDNMYECAFCDAQYLNNKEIRLHLKKHHGNFTTDDNQKYQEYISL